MKIGRHNHSKGSWKLLTSTLAFLLATTTLAACSNSTASTNSGAPGQTQNGDIHKIKHVVVIMQENRSFDSYFGTFPGADGIPMQKGASQSLAGLLLPYTAACVLLSMRLQ